MKKLIAALLLSTFSLVAVADPPFVPAPAGCKTISVTNASAATQLASSLLTGTAYQVMVYNASAVDIYVEFGTSSGVTAAVATGYPVGPGMKEPVTVPSNTTHIATIASVAGPSTLYACVGVGA
jgi:hypothetical protein